jgi:hypothetical protein
MCAGKVPSRQTPALRISPNGQGADRTIGKILSFDSEGVIKASPVILPRDCRGEFHELSFGEFLAQTGKECVRDLNRRLSHPVGVFQDQSLQV